MITSPNQTKSATDYKELEQLNIQNAFKSKSVMEKVNHNNLLPDN
jgi:hypothetical protein